VSEARFFISFDYKMSTIILYVYIKYLYYTYNLICDVISCYSWSCDTGKINVYDKKSDWKQEKRKYRNQREFLI